MRKGEIWIVDIPGLGGHEQQGTRPAIIIADIVPLLAIVIPCTSNLHALRFPSTASIDPSSKNGFSVSSVALVLQIRAIDKKRLKKRIGILEKRVMQDIDMMLKKMLQL